MLLLVYRKTLMQRLRAVLHILDMLYAEGHTVCIYRGAGKHGSISKGGKRMDLKNDYYPHEWFSVPCDIDCINSGSVAYIANHIGIRVNSLAKILWIDKKKGTAKPDKILATDYIPIKTENQINLPYNDFYCKTKNGDTVVGNGMCEDIRKRQLITKEIKGQLLIMHPGGGRSILSPLRQHTQKHEILNNSKLFFRFVLELIPNNITKVIIKAHPAPYSFCDYSTFVNKTIPELGLEDFHFELEVVNDDNIGWICSSEYILNFGSSTTIWLLGSDKKWINITECAKYDLDSSKRRDKQERTKNWQAWPQNITFDKLTDTLTDYDNYLVWTDEWRTLKKKYQKLFMLPCNHNVLRLLEGN